MTIFTRHFAASTTERAIKTFCQTLAALIVADGVGLLDAAWAGYLSVAGMAALVSVLTSVGSGYVGDDTPSLVDE